MNLASLRVNFGDSFQFGPSICDDPLPQSPHLRSLFPPGLSHYDKKVLQDVSDPWTLRP